MKQGNIGMFRNRETGVYAWLWKVSDPDSMSSSYFINMDNGEHISDYTVMSTKSEIKQSQKEWQLIMELSPDNALKYIHFTPPDSETCCRENIARGLADRVSKLEAKVDAARKEWSKAFDKYKNLGDTLRSAKEELDKFKDGGDVVYHYVHGKHHATDDVDWCWYATKDIADQIKPGDVILVDTRYGEAQAVVTSIEEASEYRPHKQVIGKLTKEN